MREEYGQRADGILAAYPHATNADALKAAQDIMRESTFAWHTWAWAMLQSEKGKGPAQGARASTRRGSGTEPCARPRR